MDQKNLNLDEILKQLSAPQAVDISARPGGSPVYYGSNCHFNTVR